MAASAIETCASCRYCRFSIDTVDVSHGVQTSDSVDFSSRRAQNRHRQPRHHYVRLGHWRFQSEAPVERGSGTTFRDGPTKMSPKTRVRQQQKQSFNGSFFVKADQNYVTKKYCGSPGCFRMTNRMPVVQCKSIIIRKMNTRGRDNDPTIAAD